jgi:hypothetical protein
MIISRMSPITPLPLFTLLHPRAQTRRLLVLLVVGLLLGSLAVAVLRVPLWGATTLVLALLLPPAVCKWQDDAQRFGVPLMILSILVALQGFHGLEHLAQWIEFHLLGWSPKDSSGLISAANVEWIHFVWNWSVVSVVAIVLWLRVRNVWGWLLLAWALAHSLEHTYLFVRYLQYVELLRASGSSTSFAQGMPGILGREGWLAAHQTAIPAVGFICTLAPQLVSYPRLDIHFGWNVGETLLLLAFAHTAMRRHLLGNTPLHAPWGPVPAPLQARRQRRQ